LNSFAGVGNVGNEWRPNRNHLATPVDQMLVTNILIELKLNECALRGGLIESHAWMAIKTTNRVELDPSN